MKNCIKSQIKDDIIATVFGQSTYYEVRDNEIFIPVNESKKGPDGRERKLIPLAGTRDIARRSVKALNEKYKSEKYGELVSANTAYTDGSGVNIHIPLKLIQAYEKKFRIQESRQAQVDDWKRAGKDETDYTDMRYMMNFAPATTEDIDDVFANEEQNEEPLFDDSILPAFDKQIMLKQNNLIRAQRRIREYNRQLRDEYATNREMQKEILSKRDRLQELAKALEEQISVLQGRNALQKFVSYAEDDLQRLEELKDSLEPDDVSESEQIIDFYTYLDPRVHRKDHPFHTEDEMYDGNELRPEMKPFVEVYDNLLRKANEYKGRLDANKQRAALNAVNQDNLIQKTKKKDLTLEEVFHTENGMKDIDWVSMFIMDVQHGIFSKNPLLAQVGYNMLDKTVSREKLLAAQKIKRIDELKKILDQKDKRDKIPDLNKWGLFPGKDYSVFFSKDKFNSMADAVTQRFSSKMYRDKKTVREMWKSQTNRIYKSQGTSQEKKIAHNRVYDNKRKWFRQNFILFDIRVLPEIKSFMQEMYNNDFIPKDVFDKIATKYIEDTEGHKSKLLELLGENGYKEELIEQKTKLQEFMLGFLNKYEDLLTKFNAEEDFTQEQFDRELMEYQKTNNPFVYAESNYEFKEVELYPGGAERGDIVRCSAVFNHSIPRKFKAVETKVDGKYKMVEGGQETGYYDERFSIIESDEHLLELHYLLRDLIRDIYNNIPEEDRDKFNPFSVPVTNRTLIEILSRPEYNRVTTLVEAWRWLWDKIKMMISQKVQNHMSNALINPITGIPEYKINTTFLRGNKQEIKRRFELESLKLKQLLGISPGASLPTSFDLTTASDSVRVFFSDLFQIGVTNDDFQKRFPGVDLKNISLDEILNSGVTHQVVTSKSLDLPKIMKVYYLMMAEYKARQETLPMLKIIKEEYESIKKPSTTNTGVRIINRTGKTRPDGKRTRAISQYNSWFKRGVLGKYESRNEIESAVFNSKRELEETDSKGIKKILERFRTGFNNKVYTYDEKQTKKDIDNAWNALNTLMEKEESPEEIASIRQQMSRLESMRENLGQYVSVASIFDTIFNFIRLQGLGWNVSASMTNFAEGQIANILAASSGDYFPEHLLDEANHIVKASMIRNISAGRIKSMPGMRKTFKDAQKLRNIMDYWDILQDASNELQKASAKSAFFSFKRFEPYEIVRRTEYLNQAPIVYAMLKSAMIEGKDGTKISLWDAMDQDWNIKDENFKTKENIYNFGKLSKVEKQAMLKENAGINTDLFNTIKSGVIEALVKIHGDYNDLRGNMASEFITGKALMMFKRWVGSQLFKRFATEQDVIALGIENYKGRYRSFTPTSGALHGAAIGALAAGPVGSIIFGAGGLAWGLFKGIRTPDGIQNQLGVLHEGFEMLKQTVLKGLGMPINLFAGKQLIKPKWDKLENSGYTARDVRNIKANITELAIMLWMTGLLLFIKGLTWDDDDEEESPRRMAHNVLVNKLMQLSRQTTGYLDGGMIKNTLGVDNIALLRFIDNAQKTIRETADYINGDDIIPTGPNAGESSLKNQFGRTFGSSPTRGNFFYGKSAQQQFQPTPFDKMFWGDEKDAQRELKIIRLSYKKELEEKYKRELKSGKMVEKDIDKMVREKVPYAKNKEYVKTLKEVKKNFK